MAVTSVNASIRSSGSVTYTIPAGKQFVGSVFAATGITNVQFAVNGVLIGTLNVTVGGGTPATQPSLRPICADAGDVLSMISGQAGISGRLYDV